MAASTANRNLDTRVVSSIPYAVADNVVIYLYCCVCTNSAGLLILAADTAGLVYAGIAYENVDNTVVGHTSGGVTCNVRPPNTSPEDRFLVMDAVSATQAWVGAAVMFTDDHTVALTSTNSVKAGFVVQLLSTTKVVVDTSRNV